MYHTLKFVILSAGAGMDIRKLYRISDYEWSIQKTGAMNVDALIVGSQELVENMDDAVYEQLTHAAGLPGIVDRIIALPDAHAGYGFPIGGVAAFDPSEGVICPGAVGYDINCGVRIVTTNLIFQDIEKKVDSLIREFYKVIPSGVGAKGKIALTKKELSELTAQGASWVIKNRGLGKVDDLNYIEDGGVAEGADPGAVSEEGLQREKNQLGTLGAGNHYVELQIVEEIFDIERARVFGLFKNQVVVSFHTGSRGLGHQVCTDYTRLANRYAAVNKLPVPNRELAYFRPDSPEGRNYLGAMRAATNYAFANRQVISHAIDQVLNNVIKDVDTNIMYDIGHNTLKFETHRVGASRRDLLVYRKGSTRSFPGRAQGVMKPYRVTGQPVIVGGSMGDFSYILAGTEEAMLKTFGSTVHGAGRTMSRTAAKKAVTPEHLAEELKKLGVSIKVKNRAAVVDEAPEAYKNIDEVIKSVSKPNISIRVARLRPIGVIKG